jgi:hypothetical protein
VSSEGLFTKSLTAMMTVYIEPLEKARHPLMHEPTIAVFFSSFHQVLYYILYSILCSTL